MREHALGYLLQGRGRLAKLGNEDLPDPREWVLIVGGGHVTHLAVAGGNGAKQAIVELVNKPPAAQGAAGDGSYLPVPKGKKAHCQARSKSLQLAKQSESLAGKVLGLPHAPNVTKEDSQSHDVSMEAGTGNMAEV
eukprot:1692724-Amphidinium_carterae.1